MAGQTILVRGGTSSVGMLAIQMAKRSGLTVLGTTRSPEKAILLLEKGADQVLIDDGRLEPKVREIYPDGMDKILELIGTGTLKDSLRCAAPGGAVCMTGMLAEQWSVPDFAPMEFIPATVQLTVYDSGQIRVGAEHFRRFILDIESGLIAPGIGRTFPLADIADAHRLMETNAAGGKIVILNQD
jgi:NADPH:quinone reductase